MPRIGSISSIRNHALPSKKGLEPCAKIAALSALLAGIIYAGFSAQRFFFPKKLDQVALLPNLNSDGLELIRPVPESLVAGAFGRSESAEVLPPKEELPLTFDQVYALAVSANDFSKVEKMIAAMDPKKLTSQLPGVIAVGRIRLANLMIRHGADVNQLDTDGTTLLFAVVYSDKPEFVESLLKAGANPNVTDKKGLTPLVYAVRMGNKRIASLLIENKADIQTPCQGKSPLAWAIARDHNEIAQSLILAKANLETRDSEGMTPLVSAIRKGNQPIVDLLVSRGADLRSKCDGKSPLAWALAEERWGIIVGLARAADPFDADSKTGISVYGSMLEKGSVSLLRILTGTSMFGHFQDCKTLHEFFSAAFPRSTPKSILEWKGKYLPDTSLLDEMSLKIQERGTRLPDAEEIIVEDFQNMDETSRWEAVWDALEKQNPLFSFALSASGLEPIRFTAYGKLPGYDPATHELRIACDLSIPKIAAQLYEAVAFAIHKDAFSKAEQSAKEGREEYVREMVAIEREARRLASRLYYSSFDPSKTDVQALSRADFYRQEWDRKHSEAYLSRDWTKFKESLKEIDRGYEGAWLVSYRGNMTETEGFLNGRPKTRLSLQHAVLNTNIPCANLLISRGSDVNEDRHGSNLLQQSLSYSPQAARVLLEAGADVESRKKGKTPLVEAIYWNRNSFVDLLIEYKSDIHSACERKSPLAWAIEGNNLHAARSLIAAGADPFRADSEWGETQSPYAFMMQRYSYAPVQWLRIFTGTETLPQFDSCKNIHDFFAILYPPSAKEVLNWDIKKNFYLSPLDEIELADKGIGVPPAEIRLPALADGLATVKSVLDALLKRNHLFAKAWKYANRNKEIRVTTDGPFVFKRWMSEIAIDPTLDTALMARHLSFGLVHAVWAEAMQEIETRGVGREKYAIDCASTKLAIDDLASKLGVFILSGMYPDIEASRNLWDLNYGEDYLKYHTRETKKRILEIAGFEPSQMGKTRRQ